MVTSNYDLVVYKFKSYCTLEHWDENIGKPPALGYRHVLVLIGFSSLFLITAQRLSLSVAIVVMVNQTEPNLSNGKYFAATTCPENEETKNASWKKREGKFLWDSKEQGLILGIGFFGFSLAAIPVSRLVRTFQARRVTLFGSLLSSVTTLLCPVASEFHVNAMIVVQFIRGIGQGLLFLSLFALMANWFHPNERGLLSTIVISGYSIGSMFAAAISGFICDTPELGWPAVFYVIAEVQPWNDPTTETKHNTESKDTLELDSEYQMDIVTHM
ncbi:Sodium-dependent phosphate transport protein 3 like protein [Argiope bruennichi]|uniref:Sodium-dependent phosphate transport protein 3 like protein n=1 Tax=Argiope bruennichi TaxID=94029 RepID=A0A8T0FBM2_ARGBR|nr:Sodium-dependent phosphate transport protein 3 like protein [Argiope bruennichi]